MIKQQCGYYNVCELLYIHGHPWTTIISTGTPHLIYLGPLYTKVLFEYVLILVRFFGASGFPRCQLL